MDAWLSYTKSGPSHKHWSTPIDHGTRDGIKTLCGADVFGEEKSIPFADATIPCKRCASSLAKGRP